MKQNLSTPIDFYLETQKINPFHLHLNSNASSQDLIHLRNSAFVLNKLSLLNLELMDSASSSSFQEECLELYAVSLQAVINNSLMPYKDFQSVRDLVWHVEHYYQLLQKLTFNPEAHLQQTHSLKKKISLNSFWPRIRVLLISIEEKIPSSHQYIRQYVTIRRGLLQTDKKYFVSQMMAKKIQTQQLRELIKRYQHGEQKNQKLFQNLQDQNKEQKQNQANMQDWSRVRRHIRAIPLIDDTKDWKLLCQYLNHINNNKKNHQQQLEYITDILRQYLISTKIWEPKYPLENITQKLQEHVTSHPEKYKQPQNIQKWVQLRSRVLMIIFQAPQK